MKKIAVYITGQLRSFEKIWEDNKKILENNSNISIDYYLFTWKKNGNTWRTLESRNKNIKNLFIDPYIFTPKIIDEYVHDYQIKKLLPECYFKINEIDEVDVLNNDGLKNILKNFPGDQNMAFASFCLWKSIEECNELRKSKEINQNYKYDAIMRIRPDWKLKRNPLTKYFNEEKDLLFFSSNISKKIKFDSERVTDVCFVSNIEIMNSISNLYKDLKNEINTKGWRQYDFAYPNHHKCLIGESALYWHLKKNKIFINKIPQENFGYIERLSYTGEYEKKIFSFKVLIRQILNMPREFIKFLS